MDLRLASGGTTTKTERMHGETTESGAAKALPASGVKHCELLIAQFRKTGEVWGLARGEEWAMETLRVGRQEELTSLLLWPSAETAQACRSEAWNGYEPRRISAQEWQDCWLPKLRSEKRKIGAFLSPDGRGIRLNPDQFTASMDHAGKQALKR